MNVDEKLVEDMKKAMVEMLEMKLEDIKSGKAEIISITGSSDSGLLFHIDWVKDEDNREEIHGKA